jgi:hypothetical protein
MGAGRRRAMEPAAGSPALPVLVVGEMFNGCAAGRRGSGGEREWAGASAALSGLTSDAAEDAEAGVTAAF